MLSSPAPCARRLSKLIEKKPEPLTRCKRVASTRSCGPTPKLSSTSFTLDISTTYTLPQYGLLMNRFEMPDSKIVSLSASTPERYDETLDECFELTNAELREPGFFGKTLSLESVWMDKKNRIVDETHMSFTNRKGYFTVQEVIRKVESFEKEDRPKTKWFGGIDCHHVFFEGLRPNKTGSAFVVCWGS